MTAAQKEAFNRIEELMREHFEAAVIVVQGEVEGSDRTSDIRSTWHGGYAASIGLLELGKLQVWRTEKDETE